MLFVGFRLLAFVCRLRLKTITLLQLNESSSFHPLLVSSPDPELERTSSSPHASNMSRPDPGGEGIEDELSPRRDLFPNQLRTGDATAPHVSRQTTQDQNRQQHGHQDRDGTPGSYGPPIDERMPSIDELMANGVEKTREPQSGYGGNIRQTEGRRETQPYRNNDTSGRPQQPSNPRNAESTREIRASRRFTGIGPRQNNASHQAQDRGGTSSRGQPSTDQQNSIQDPPTGTSFPRSETRREEHPLTEEHEARQQQAPGQASQPPDDDPRPQGLARHGIQQRATHGGETDNPSPGGQPMEHNIDPGTPQPDYHPEPDMGPAEPQDEPANPEAENRSVSITWSEFWGVFKLPFCAVGNFVCKIVGFGLSFCCRGRCCWVLVYLVVLLFAIAVLLFAIDFAYGICMDFVARVLDSVPYGNEISNYAWSTAGARVGGISSVLLHFVSYLAVSSTSGSLGEDPLLGAKEKPMAYPSAVPYLEQLRDHTSVFGRMPLRLSSLVESQLATPLLSAEELKWAQKGEMACDDALKEMRLMQDDFAFCEMQLQQHNAVMISTLKSMSYRISAIENIGLGWTAPRSTSWTSFVKSTWHMMTGQEAKDRHNIVSALLQMYEIFVCQMF